MKIVRFNSTTILTGLVAAAALIAFTPARAHADCQSDTDRTDHRLHEAIAKHGPDSREANDYRRQLVEIRERCWSKEHRWWDADAHAWRTEHWDDHDDHLPH